MYLYLLVYKDPPQIKQHLHSKKWIKKKNFRDLYSMAFEGRDLLLSNELDKFGNLLDESWKIKSSLNKRMSNTKIDNLYEFSKSEVH